MRIHKYKDVKTPPLPFLCQAVQYKVENFSEEIIRD